MRIVVDIDNAALRDAPRAVALAARGVLFGVVVLNVLLMRDARKRGTPYPKLYKSGVRFAPEPNQGKWEDFATCQKVIERRWGDCDDLVAYRVAELRESGEDPKANIKIYWRDVPNMQMVRAIRERGHTIKLHPRKLTDTTEWFASIDGEPVRKFPTTRIYHGQVRRSNIKSKQGLGVVEDPARMLGM